MPHPTAKEPANKQQAGTPARSMEQHTCTRQDARGFQAEVPVHTQVEGQVVVWLLKGEGFDAETQVWSKAGVP